MTSLIQEPPTDPCFLLQLSKCAPSSFWALELRCSLHQPSPGAGVPLGRGSQRGPSSRAATQLGAFGRSSLAGEGTWVGQRGAVGGAGAEPRTPPGAGLRPLRRRVAGTGDFAKRSVREEPVGVAQRRWVGGKRPVEHSSMLIGLEKDPEQHGGCSSVGHRHQIPLVPGAPSIGQEDTPGPRAPPTGFHVRDL